MICTNPGTPDLPIYTEMKPCMHAALCNPFSRIRRTLYANALSTMLHSPFAHAYRYRGERLVLFVSLAALRISLFVY